MASDFHDTLHKTGTCNSIIRLVPFFPEREIYARQNKRITAGLRAANVIAGILSFSAVKSGKASECAHGQAHWDLLWCHLHVPFSNLYSQRLLLDGIKRLSHKTYKMMNVIPCLLRSSYSPVDLVSCIRGCARWEGVLYVKRHRVLVVKKVKTLFIVCD